MGLSGSDPVMELQFPSLMGDVMPLDTGIK